MSARVRQHRETTWGARSRRPLAHLNTQNLISPNASRWTSEWNGQGDKEMEGFIFHLTYTHVFKGVQSRLSCARGGVIEVDSYAITLQCAQTT
jgi:hypothetical protein